MNENDKTKRGWYNAYKQARDECADMSAQIGLLRDKIESFELTRAALEDAAVEIQRDLTFNKKLTAELKKIIMEAMRQ